MNRKISYIGFSFTILFLITFAVLFTVYKTSENYYRWIIMPSYILVIVIPSVVVGIYAITSITLMIIKNKMSWLSLSWILASIASLLTVEFVSNIYLSFGTNLQYLFIALVLIGFTFHFSTFIYGIVKNKKWSM